ncbi:GAF domain-containing protein [Cyanobacteria bacterium FACHB-472]|nr:GAF domain-containing protein [Cyanobacteria bacterium FACHB-472]
MPSLNNQADSANPKSSWEAFPRLGKFNFSKAFWLKVPTKQHRYKQRWQPRELIVLSILVGSTLGVSAIAAISYQVVRGLILENLQQQALLEVQQGRDEIDQWLSNRKTEVEMLANSPIVRSMDWSVAQPYLKSELQRFKEIHQLTIVNSEGWGANTSVGSHRNNVKDREWFIKAMAGQLSAANPVVSRTTGLLQINISAPIMGASGTQVLGAMGGAIKVDRVIQVVSRLQEGAGSYAFALNSQGVAIAHPNPKMIGSAERQAPSFLQSSNPGLAAIAQHMVAKQAGIELIPVNGSWNYFAYVPLKEADWSIALVIPRQNIESYLGALNLLATVLGGLLVIALIGAWRQVHLFEQTRTRAEQEALLNRLVRRIRESLELQTIVQTTVTELATLTQLDRVLFGWYDPQSRTLELVGDSHAQTLTIQPRKFQSNLSIDIAACLQQTEALHLLFVDAELEQTPLELKAHAYLALPIPLLDGCCGYLIGLHAHYLSQQDRELLKAVVDQLAVAITQAQLYNQTQQQITLLNQTLAKLNHTQLQLVQSEKMSSLGQMVAGIAHEINNPVNFIYGNLTHASSYIQDLLELIQLYQEQYPQPTPQIQDKAEDMDLEFLKEDLSKLLASMQVGAQRIRDIVQSLRVFSRLDESEVKDVDIHQGIDSTLMLLQNRLKAKPEHPAIEVVKEYGQLPKIECHAGQLNQVFMNLLTNAIDAIEEFNAKRSYKDRQANPGRITIRTQVLTSKRIAIRIADNGTGIAEDIQQRLFDPFFTTKTVGKGTGMGLAMSYQIVTETHRGQLRCISAPGRGAEFAIEIPIQQSQQQS